MPYSNSVLRKATGRDNWNSMQDVGIRSGNLAFDLSFVLAVSARACPLNLLKFSFSIFKMRKIINVSLNVS